MKYFVVVALFLFSTSSFAVREIKSEKEFDENVLKSTRAVLVDFYASWCGPCKYMSHVLDTFETMQNKVPIVKVEISELESVADRYRIKRIPTLVLFEKGKEKKRNTGIMDFKGLYEFCEIQKFKK